MSNYRGHLVGGAAFFLLCILGLASTSIVGLSSRIIYFLCALAGALFPDLDTVSKGRKLYLKSLPFALIWLFILGQLYAAVLILIFTGCAFAARHRGLFHRVWFIIVSAFLFAGFLSLALQFKTKTIAGCWLFFLAGALSHLVFDYGFQRRHGSRRFIQKTRR